MSRAKDPEAAASDAIEKGRPAGFALLDEKAMTTILKEAEPCAWQEVFEAEANPSLLLRCELYKPTFAVAPGVRLFEVITKTFCKRKRVQYRRGFLTDTEGRLMDELLLPYAAEGDGEGGWLYSVPRAWSPIGNTHKWVVAYFGYEEFYVVTSAELAQQLQFAKDRLGDLFRVNGEEPKAFTFE